MSEVLYLPVGRKSFSNFLQAQSRTFKLLFWANSIHIVFNFVGIFLRQRTLGMSMASIAFGIFISSMCLQLSRVPDNFFQRHYRTLMRLTLKKSLPYFIFFFGLFCAIEAVSFHSPIERFILTLQFSLTFFSTWLMGHATIVLLKAHLEYQIDPQQLLVNVRLKKNAKAFSQTQNVIYLLTYSQNESEEMTPSDHFDKAA